ncbi:hypothetical protein [Shewanella sp. KCT]|uniref:hypothetical protein n=1 Tax=Shewanella sp. KCT TaxID=2569535 RepID=UPI00118466D7|nr:hypothetical protein [Shewanella sp. KCT]TVP11779.1 hypothetical protein AYI87_15220 [Shewanella sp. KCT]
MTIKEEAQAELASNPKAKLFICSVPCQHCGGHERYISSLDCTYCRKLTKSTNNRRDTRVNASAQRMESAVRLYRYTDMTLGEVAKAAKVSNHRLSNELKRQGIEMRNYRNQGQSVHDPRADEFAEARGCMMAATLLNTWYRSAHG